MAWPASATGFSLESADSADATTWTTVTNAPILIDGQPTVILEPDAATKIALAPQLGSDSATWTNLLRDIYK